MISRLGIQLFIVSLAISVGLSEYTVHRHTMCTGRQDGDQLPNRLDCSSYFVCIHGIPQLFRCNDNLYYDGHLKVCNWPENVTCGHVTEIEAGPSKPPVPPNFEQNKPHQNPPKPNDDAPPYEQVQGTPEYDVPSAPHQSQQSQNPSHQPAQGPPGQNLYEYYAGIAVSPNSESQFVCTRDGFYFAPHPNDCQKYFICANRQIHIHQCGFGIHWNYIHSQCDLSDRGMCYSRNQWSGNNGGFDTNVPANHEIHSGELVTEPDHEAIDEVEDSAWNLIEKEMANITAAEENPTGPNEVAEHEVVPENAQVPGNNAQIPENSENNAAEEIQPGNDANQEQPSEPAEPQNEVEEKLEPDCPEHQQAFFPHLKDCKKYYICISGMAILTTCPENMTWNAERSHCSDEPNFRCHSFY